MRPLTRIIGLVLLGPAALALLLGFVLPSVRTIRSSFQASDPVLLTPGRWVGLDNYRAAGEGLTRALGTAVLVALLPLLVVLVLAPVLAYAATRAGRRGRWVLRVAVSLP